MTIRTIPILLFLFLLFGVTASAQTANPQSATVPNIGTSLILLTGTVPSGTIHYRAPGQSGVDNCPGCTAPTHGTLGTLSAATGFVTYAPTGGFTGTDTFTFTVDNTAGVSAFSTAATVTITVTNQQTTITDRLTDGAGQPRAGKVTFQLLHSAMSPSGTFIPQSSSVTATLDVNGNYSLSVYPSTSLSPQTYYQVLYSDSTTLRQESLGVYLIPPSVVPITLAPYVVITTNNAALYELVTYPALYSFYNGPSVSTQGANLFNAGPTSGGAALPTYRHIVAGDLPNTAVTPGTYTTANLTVDAQGRITNASNGTGGGAPGGTSSQLQYRLTGSTFGGITNTSTDGTTLSMTSPQIITGIKDSSNNQIIALTPDSTPTSWMSIANSRFDTPSISALGINPNASLKLIAQGPNGVVSIIASSLNTPLLTVGTPSGLIGEINFANATNNNLTLLSAPNGAPSLDYIFPLTAPTAGQLLSASAPVFGVVTTSWITASGTGTVTSVGLSLPAMFSVSGSPVTSAGTLTATLANQTGNSIFGSPAGGGSGAPTFRSLVAADLPLVPTNKLATLSGTGGTVATTTGSLISGNCAKFDASGNIVDNGAACGAGGGGGTPGGSTGQIQVNNSGVFAGTPAITVSGGVPTIGQGATNNVVLQGYGATLWTFLAGGLNADTETTAKFLFSGNERYTMNTDMFLFKGKTFPGAPASGYGGLSADASGNAGYYSRSGSAWKTFDSISAGGSGVTSITAGTGLSGGTITTTGTIALANTAVTAASYTNANITVDAQGRLTAASNGSGGGSTFTTLTESGQVVTQTGTSWPGAGFKIINTSGSAGGNVFQILYGSGTPAAVFTVNSAGYTTVGGTLQSSSDLLFTPNGSSPITLHQVSASQLSMTGATNTSFQMIPISGAGAHYGEIQLQGTPDGSTFKTFSIKDDGSSGYFNTSTAHPMEFDVGNATAFGIDTASSFPNIRFFNATGSYGGGSGVIFITNASTVPTSNPTGGVLCWAESGGLKCRGSSGTITTVAAP